MSGAINIIIDDIEFELISYDATAHDNRGSVLIKSRYLKGSRYFIKPFFVYRSNSEMGFWRFDCIDDEESEHLHKGSHDYVQQTFIHIKLQLFINENIIRLPHDIHRPFLCDEQIMNEINNVDRKLDIEPFDKMEFKCGQKHNEDDIKKVLTNIDDKILIKYEINNIRYISPYNFDNIFEKEILKIKLRGHIWKINLKNKVGGRNLILYVLHYNFRSCDENDSKLYYKDKIIPIFLTFSDKITRIGTYVDYVHSGIFICKILEYKSQCTSSDVCTKSYAFVGDRYDDLKLLNNIRIYILTRFGIIPDEIPIFAGPTMYKKRDGKIGYRWELKYLKYKNKYLQLKKQLESH
jgi:hypothetical protein